MDEPLLLQYRALLWREGIDLKMSVDPDVPQSYDPISLYEL